MKIKSILHSIAIAGVIVHQASAFCAYNRSDKNQVWYIFKDASGNNAKRLLQGLEGTAISFQGVVSGVAIGKSIAGAVASEGASTPQAVAAIAAEAVKNKNIVFDTVRLANLSGAPKAGTIIRVDNGIAGKLGKLISMSSVGALWGKSIGPGGKECWNKKDVKKDLHLDSETSPLFYLVIKNTDYANIKEIAFSEARGVHEGVEAY